MTHRWPVLIFLAILTLLPHPASVREGDTLLPITIAAPLLETSPDGLLSEDDANSIIGRVQEARNSGVPVAVRIVDMSQDMNALPQPLRRFADTDFSSPLSDSTQDEILRAWTDYEPIETSASANDGFLLLVLMPADRTQTQALWWIGPNALPLNGLTASNIDATQSVMQAQFDQGNVALGTYLGLSEFSYNIQFGEPERLTLSDNQNALNRAVIPLALGIALSSAAIPVLALWFSRRTNPSDPISVEITPWQAAALRLGRATEAIATAMLLEAVHEGRIHPTTTGGLKITEGAANDAVERLAAYADSDGVVPKAAVLEIDGIVRPVRLQMEDELAQMGAMNANANVERTCLLLSMGFAAFLSVLAVVPTVVSMQRIGIFAIALCMICVAFGWWWLSRRSYTTTAGQALMTTWLNKATAEDRFRYDLVVHQTYLVDHTGGPDVSLQMKLVRELRGLGAN